MDTNLSLGKIVKRVLATQIAPAVLAVSLFLSGGALMEASAFSFEEPTVTYEEFSEYTGVRIFINGRFVEFNDFMGYPTIINDTTYIPVRVVAEAFNAYVYYSEALERVYISKQGSQMIMYLKNGKIEFVKDLGNPDDRKEIITGAKTITINDRTYLPLRIIYEIFGANVEWREEDTTVIVTNNYEENSKYIDFKDEKVLAIKDVDLNKIVSY